MSICLLSKERDKILDGWEVQQIRAAATSTGAVITRVSIGVNSLPDSRMRSRRLPDTRVSAFGHNFRVVWLTILALEGTNSHSVSCDPVNSRDWLVTTCTVYCKICYFSNWRNPLSTRLGKESTGWQLLSVGRRPGERNRWWKLLSATGIRATSRWRTRGGARQSCL